MGSQFPAWLNGIEAESLSLQDRAIAYGDGVFETIRNCASGFLFEFHWQRLQHGLHILSIPQDLSLVINQFHQYRQQYQPGLIKIIVTQGAGGRGYVSPANPSPSVIIQGFELPIYPSKHYAHGVDLFMCQTPVTVNPVFRGIKHLNRLEQVRARNEFGVEFAEGLMCSLDGEVLEGTMSNLFYGLDGKIMTPPLDRLAVTGTMQRYLMEQCEDVITVEQRSITLDELLAAEEVFVCNSVFGIWPVKSIMNASLNVSKLKSGPSVTQLLQQKVMSQFS